VLVLLIASVDVRRVGEAQERIPDVCHALERTQVLAERRAQRVIFILYGTPAMLRAAYRKCRLHSLKIIGMEALALQKNCGFQRANRYIDWKFGEQGTIADVLEWTGYLTVSDVRKRQD
jgi:hypothetical protein